MRHLPLLVLLLAGCQSRESRVVVYCAQDQEFAEGVFADFEAKQSLKIQPKFDTEANKSVSLAANLEAERERPRCDVHWNNEILNSIRLARAGLYEPMSYPEDPFPAWTRAKDGTWHAFAARARVLIVNTNLVPEAERPKSLLDLTQPKWKGKIAMAKPQFGTTATQAACLFEALGPDGAKAFFRGLKTNDVHIVAGNKQVAVGVAKGDFAIGFTDTDDALIEKNAERPVDLIFADREKNDAHPRLGVLYIPNTVALVKGAPNRNKAMMLLEYLIQPDVEKRLAEGGGFQIPLNPQVKANLPASILRPEQVHRMDVDFEKAADRWDEAQAFLRDEFAR